ncbi:MAG: GNAT family N-acetyltransferase [Dehalococcoidia bacterium]
MTTTKGWHGTVRRVDDDDRDWVDEHVRRWWGGPFIASKEHMHRPSRLDGFLAEANGKPAGLVTMYIEGDACEVVTLNSFEPGSGAGVALMRAAESYAREYGCLRLWLMTTNDNTHALRFYQRYGMHIAAVHVGVINDQRRLKPAIPHTGHDGIPIRDEIELALDLRS